MQFVGKAAVTEVDYMFDNDASTNFVSRAFAKLLHGLTVKPSDVNVRIGTEAQCLGAGQVLGAFKLVDYQDKVKYFVVDMVTRFQVLRGDTWLNMVEAAFKYASKKCLI
jgi:hypothetical protein